MIIQTSAEDGKRRTLDIPGFRQLIEIRQGRLLASSREYLRDMSNSVHLNFNREVLDRLLPSARCRSRTSKFRRLLPTLRAARRGRSRG